jgi:hypothetical protein
VALTPAPGLTASLAEDSLVLLWNGDGLEGLLTLGIESGVRAVEELAARRKHGRVDGAGGA